MNDEETQGSKISLIEVIISVLILGLVFSTGYVRHRRPRTRDIVRLQWSSTDAGSVEYMLGRIGMALFAKPTMVQGYPEIVTLILHSTPGIVGSPVVSVTLKGDGFKITEEYPAEQTIDVNGTTWRWYVLPEVSGDRRLTVQLSAVILHQGQHAFPRVLQTTDHEIAVAMNPVYLAGRFLSKNWQWTIAAIPVIVATIIGAIAWIRRRRRQIGF